MLRHFIFTVATLLFATAAFGEATWFLELHTGFAYNFDTTLEIDPGFQLTADYATNAFEGGPYYSVRVGRWNPHHGWEVEFLHHKIYLENLPPGVETFRIANGYNMLLIDYAVSTRGFTFRAGAGLLIAYPLARMDGAVTDGGYNLAGIATQGAVGRRIFLGPRWFLSIEAKLTFGTGRVDLTGGAEAKIPNVALHGLAGIGLQF